MYSYAKMVIGYHIILTGYGHWLPNDPRGSLSQELHAPRLTPLGDVHYGLRESQPAPQELRAFYQRAQQRLHYPLRWWNSAERQGIGEAFGQVIAREDLTCHACAILRSHVHALFRKHHLKAEGISARLQDQARRVLKTQQLISDHPVFSADSCHHFKSKPAQMYETIEYIRGNYTKHNIAPIDFPFVSLYDGWPEN